MRAIISEKNLVVVLFVLVLITFALAQEDSKKLEKAYIGVSASASSTFASLPGPQLNLSPSDNNIPANTLDHSE